MTQFMQEYRTENNGYQSQAARHTYAAGKHKLVQQDEQQQKKKCQVDAKLHAKQPACENGPASHGCESILYTKLDV